MTVQQTISDRLIQALEPGHLTVDNESHMHNVPDDSESHFRVVIVAEQFDGLSLIKRHRTINNILSEQLAGPVHALALHTYTAAEWRARGETAMNSPECHGGSKR